MVTTLSERVQANLALADRLRLSVGRLARRLRQQSLGGLTPSQRSTLATLGNHGPMTMGRLARIESISRPSATGIVSRLLEQGLVDRRPHPDDGRAMLVGLSSAGTAVLEQGKRERTAVLAEYLDTLDDHERSVLDEAIGILNRLVDSE